MRSTLVLAVLCVLSPLAQAVPRQGAVLAGDRGYLVLPPDLVSGPTVVQTVASDDGRYLLAVRHTERLTSEAIAKEIAGGPQPAKEMALVFWDGENRTSKEVWRTPSQSPWVRQLVWMPRSRCGFMELGARAEHAGQDGGAAEITDLIQVTPTQTKQTTFDPDEIVDLQVSPCAAAAVLRVRSAALGYKPGAAWVIGPSALPGKRLALPEGLDLVDVHWTATGAPVLQMYRGGAGASEREAWLLVDVRTGVLHPVAGGENQYKPKPTPPSPLTVSLAPLVIRQRETSASTSAAWLVGDTKGPYPRALISSDCEDAWLTPTLGDVMYRHQGVLLARKLIMLPRDEFIVARQRAEIAELQSHANQVVRAIIMYSNDNGDYIPPADNFADSIMPYLKDPSLLDGFEYVDLGHVQQSGVDSPAETVIGTIPGPGGTVVAYLDGHVKWRPDK